jgi:hypothetical protein
MRFQLAPDWDVPFDAPTAMGVPTGHFVGRAHEIDLLVNELIRSPRRSIFISGHRGVGKTALVHKALFELRNRAGDRQFLFVLLSGHQLDVSVSDSSRIDARAILTNLIRRLYSSASSTDDVGQPLRERVELLYEKAVAKEFLERRRAKQRAQERASSSTRSELSIRSTTSLAVALGSALSLTLAATTGLAHTIGGQLLLVLAAGPVPLFATWSWRHVRQREVEATVESEAERLYDFDASVGNLVLTSRSSIDTLIMTGHRSSTLSTSSTSSMTIALSPYLTISRSSLAFPRPLSFSSEERNLLANLELRQTTPTQTLKDYSGRGSTPTSRPSISFHVPAARRLRSISVL